jgi:hypothetical protein
MKSKLDSNDKQQMKDENNKRESQTQKLLTEFTPFTGLRLRVPLQWVSIQLMISKWYKDVPRSSEHQLRQQNRMLCKALKTPLSWQLQFSLQKAKKAKS